MTVILQGGHQICSKDIGQVLRILGQNPTEDEIITMVLKVLKDPILLLLTELNRVPYIDKGHN